MGYMPNIKQTYHKYNAIVSFTSSKLVNSCYFVSRRHLLLLHTGKTHATKRNDQFCPQSHAITEKAFEHL